MKEVTKNYMKQIVVIILTALAKKTLIKYKPKIIAITGSVGKTTTKDIIFAAIAPYKNVRKSEKSFNSEIGIPLTILGCKNAWSNPILWLENFFKGLFLILFKNQYPEWLVLEVGVDRPGDIKKVTEWLKPDIVVLTRLPNIPVHVEYFSSTADLVEEKLYLVKALKSTGVVIINADDENLIKAVNGLEDMNTRRVTYGLVNDADIQASDVLIEYKIVNDTEVPSGLVFEVSSGNEEAYINIDNVLGKHIALACTAAIAVGLEINIPLNNIVKGLSTFDKPNGRMKLIKGIKNSLIIDDSYNSSPVAVEELLNTLKEINTNGRKIAVLGDMLELGIYSSDEHKRIGKIVAQVSDILITVGLRAKAFAEGAMDGNMSEKNIFQYENSVEAGKEFQNLIENNDILAVKGSQGIRMERFIEEIMLDPEQKYDLLVRQNKEWKNK